MLFDQSVTVIGVRYPWVPTDYPIRGGCGFFPVFQKLSANTQEPSPYILYRAIPCAAIRAAAPLKIPTLGA